MAALNTTTMRYTKGTYFVEQEDESVKGFSVIDLNKQSEQYQIAEKWKRTASPDRWITYWIPAARLLERVEEGKCQPKAQLSDKQFSQVCAKIDHDNISAEGVA